MGSAPFPQGRTAHILTRIPSRASWARPSHPSGQFLLTLAENNPPLERRVAGNTVLCQLLFGLTAASPTATDGDALYLRVVAAGAHPFLRQRAV